VLVKVAMNRVCRVYRLAPGADFTWIGTGGCGVTARMSISVCQLRGSHRHRTSFGLRNEATPEEHSRRPTCHPALHRPTEESETWCLFKTTSNSSVLGRPIGGPNGAGSLIAAVLPYLPTRAWKLAIRRLRTWCLSCQNVLKLSANECLMKSLSN
jgi:hypothetical protein